MPVQAGTNYRYGELFADPPCHDVCLVEGPCKLSQTVQRHGQNAAGSVAAPVSDRQHQFPGQDPTASQVSIEFETTDQLVCRKPVSQSCGSEVPGWRIDETLAAEAIGLEPER